MAPLHERIPLLTRKGKKNTVRRMTRRLAASSVVPYRSGELLARGLTLQEKAGHVRYARFVVEKFSLLEPVDKDGAHHLGSRIWAGRGLPTICDHTGSWRRESLG